MDWGSAFQAIAALASAAAAVFAAVAAWRVPHSAAEHAEKLRRQNANEEETRRLKLWVFATIMQNRAHWYTEEAVRAFNLIDVVFAKATAVREAWTELYMAFDKNAGVPEHARLERLRKLLQAMAVDLGVSDDLRIDDFGRVYFPDAIAEAQLVQMLERRAALARLQGSGAPQTEWPPKPESKQ